MKEDQSHHLQKRVTLSAIKVAKPAAYFIVLMLTYSLGYLSAPSSTTTPPISSTSSTPVSNSVSIQQTLNSLTHIPTALDHFRVNAHCSDSISPELVRRTLLKRIFNGTSPYENFPPVHAGELLRPTRIKGWGSKGAVFENLIRRVKPRTIIEVGTFLGASALHMAELTSQLGLRTQILCIDDFRGWPGFRDQVRNIPLINGDVLLMYQFMQNVMTFNESESVLPVPFSSGSALDKLCEWGVYGDLIEIDAGHDFNSAWADINRAYRILRPGGVIFGHDYFTAADNRGVRRAVDLFARVNGLRVKIDGQHWVIDFT